MTILELINFLSVDQGISLKKIKPESRIVEDLGIDGDDAIEMIDHLEKKMNIDLSYLKLGRYFGSEGFFPTFFIFVPHKNKSLTVELLLSIINNATITKSEKIIVKKEENYPMSSINCPHKNKPIASFITNATDPARASWDLTPYKTAGIGPAGGTWRLIETGANLLYYSGKISADGTLVSNDYVEPLQSGIAARTSRATTSSALPDDFYSHYSYDGYMELQTTPPPPKCTTCPCPEEEE